MRVAFALAGKHAKVVTIAASGVKHHVRAHRLHHLRDGPEQRQRDSAVVQAATRRNGG